MKKVVDLEKLHDIILSPKILLRKAYGLVH